MSDELQRKYIEFQMIKQQVEQLQQQLQKFEAQSEELGSVIASLESFKKLKRGSEMLVPLASGIFAYAELKESQMVRVNVGSNVSVKKSVDDTAKLVKDQISEIENYKMTLQNNLEQMMEYAHHLQHDLMELANKDECKKEGKACTKGCCNKKK